MERVVSIKLLSEKIRFPCLMWISSRLIVFGVMLVIMPLVTPKVIEKGWWDTLFAWDSGWYYKIAVEGYNYGSNFGDNLDKNQYAIAFFPLYPLLIWLLSRTGIPVVEAGLLINNLAFLFSLIFFYWWTEEFHGREVARWSTTALAWCPYSLYGSVMYTEGLFLLFSIAALRAFERKQYIWVSIWGGLGTATRITGVALIPAFLLTAWQQKRPIPAYVASFAIAIGIGLFSLFCWLQFGDGLAFLHAQKGWRSSTGFAAHGWLLMLLQVLLGGKNVTAGYIKDPSYLLQLAGVVGAAGLLIYFRHQLGTTKVRYGFWGLWLILWLMVGDSLFKLVFIFGGLGLLIYYAPKITLTAATYSFLSYGIALNTGLTASVDRYIYAIAPIFIAIGFLCSKYPKWGRGIICLFGLLLFLYCIRFAQDFWLA